jgi:LmbE family N-acetylglucosaminyl deacetylase
MDLQKESAEIFVPDGTPVEEALARTTHMGVGAHQDDLEILAADGILKCFQRQDRWFAGVVMTNGSGSPRNGLYANYTDEEMIAVRRKEQRKAATVGEYGAQVLLDYPSSTVKDPAGPAPTEDLVALFLAARPEVVYTHNLADKHDTHVATAVRVVEALRRVPAEAQPERIYGCEIWRSLDWMLDEEKVVFDVSAHDNVQRALVSLFDSQVAGGKRYDLVTMGRRRANATYHASHETDVATHVIYAMNLRPLIDDPGLDVRAYVVGFIERLAEDVAGRIGRYLLG